MGYEVLICDDEVSRERELVENARSVAPADKYRISGSMDSGADSVRDAVRELLARRSAARADSERAPKDCLFDRADVLVLDYDLMLLDEFRTRHTGEGLARLARTFSTCDVVVVLNQFRGVHFDLGMRGHLWSYADMNIHGEMIGNAGLWTYPPWEGFRPWSWRTLGESVATQRQRKDLISEHLEQSVFDFFGLRQEDALHLSDSAFEFLGPEAETFDQLAGITFRDVPRNVDDRDAMAATELDSLRFVSARLGKWLETEILGGQDVLIDLPHLVQRYPFVLGNQCSDRDAWNAAIHDMSVVREEIPEHAWFAPEGFLSRPAVWRQRLETDERIREISYEFDYSEVPALVFLEDVSKFGSLDEAKQFRASYHNAFDARFVRNLGGIRYGPQRRFALGA